MSSAAEPARLQRVRRAAVAAAGAAILALAPQSSLAEHSESARPSSTAGPGTTVAGSGPKSHRAKARRLLTGMQRALASRTYVGTAVHERYFEATEQRHTEVLRVAHRVRGREQRERIEFLTGEPRELLRSSMGDRSEALCIFADRGLVLDGASARAAAPRMPVPEGALDRYRISARAGSRMAGRLTDQVTLAPRDRYRYGHRLWVDRESRLPLRTETFQRVEEPDGSQHDEVLERFYYTELALPDDLDDAALAPRLMNAGAVERRRLRLLEVSHAGANSTDGERVRLLDTTRLTPLRVPSGGAGGPAEEPNQRWKAWLPPGFLPMHGSPRSKRKGHRVYSDGLASVSIFVEPSARSDAVIGGGSDVEHSQLGVLNAVSLEAGASRVTVVGDVPVRTAERIARSVRSR